MNIIKSIKNNYKKFDLSVSAILGLGFLILSFILVTILINKYGYLLENTFASGFYGMIIYFSITVISTVFAPINAIPLLPTAVYFWGPFKAAIISILGWTCGSVIAFLISRRYGIKIVKKFVSEENIMKFESLVPKKNLFFSIILLRIFIPVDVLSYVLGLFSKIKLRTYTLATLIGVTPFAFILSYIGSISPKFQIISLIFLSLLLFYVVKKFYKFTQ